MRPLVPYAGQDISGPRFVTVETISGLQRKGLTLSEIAKETGQSIEAIDRALNEWLRARQWTKDQDARLREMWTVDGLTATEIAQAFGNVTRNSIIGRLHRLGLAKSKAPPKPKAPKIVPPPKPRGRPRKTSAAGDTKRKPKRAPGALAALPQTIPEPKRLTLFQLTDKTCKWPIGDPRHADFHFCGCDTDEGPYCKFHREMARTTFYPVRKAA